MLARLLFVADQLSVPRRFGAEDSDDLHFLTNGLFLLVAGIVLFALAVTSRWPCGIGGLGAKSETHGSSRMRQ
jgi:hypothetical protein